MQRLTNKRTWEEAEDDLAAEYGYSHIWKRLNAIENILGDEYDLDRLRVLVEADAGYARQVVFLQRKNVDGSLYRGEEG